MGYVRSGYQLEGFGDTLEFSLKPPKWLRKAQPGKILQKIAVPLAVTAGAVLIPGVAPAAAAVLRAGGRLIAKGAIGAARRVGAGAGQAVRGVRGISTARRSAHQLALAAKAAAGGTGISKALEQAARMALPQRRGGPRVPIDMGPIDQPVWLPPLVTGPGGTVLAPAAAIPGASPPFIGPPAPAYAGGGGGGGGEFPADLTTQPMTAGAAAGAPSNMGLWIAGGLAALVLAFAVMRPSRGRA